jgi:hypothetical protein
MGFMYYGFGVLITFGAGYGRALVFIFILFDDLKCWRFKVPKVTFCGCDDD